jgi:hypothetical protein
MYEVAFCRRELNMLEQFENVRGRRKDFSGSLLRLKLDGQSLIVLNTDELKPSKC